MRNLILIFFAIVSFNCLGQDVLLSIQTSENRYILADKDTFHVYLNFEKALSWDGATYISLVRHPEGGSNGRYECILQRVSESSYRAVITINNLVNPAYDGNFKIYAAKKKYDSSRGFYVSEPFLNANRDNKDVLSNIFYLKSNNISSTISPLELSKIDAKVDVYNLNGTFVKTGTQENYNIDLPYGIYLFVAETKESKFSGKFIK